MNEIEIIWQTHHHWVGIGIAAITALITFIAAFVYIQRARIMENFPTSKIGSASQDYVELVGQAKAMSSNMLKAPLSGIDCVWYRYKIEQHNGSAKQHRNVTIEKGESNDIFFIQDDTGRCVIDPLSAIKTPSKKLHWRGNTERPQTVPSESTSLYHTSVTISFGSTQVRSGDRYTYTEERIHDGDPLYVIGQFKTVGSTNDLLDKNNEISDGDGNINMQEWDAVRQTATQVTETNASNQANKTGFHSIGPAGNKRLPFILSAVPQQHMIKTYKWTSTIYLSIFLLSGSIAVMLYNGQAN